MILQDIFEFNQPNLEGGLDLSIHEEDIWPVRIHVQNLVVVPDIEMLFKWSVVESRQVSMMIRTCWCQGWWQCLQ